MFTFKQFLAEVTINKHQHPWESSPEYRSEPEIHGGAKVAVSVTPRSKYNSESGKFERTGHYTANWHRENSKGDFSYDRRGKKTKSAAPLLHIGHAIKEIVKQARSEGHMKTLSFAGNTPRKHKMYGLAADSIARKTGAKTVTHGNEHTIHYEDE